MIRVTNLVKNYGDFKAVRDISFDVDKGEIFAFLGPNGAGKTTTIKMLTTLLKPTSGKVELDGLDPSVEQNEARKRFGIVFQDPSLDDELTAYENMDFHGVLYKVPRKLRRERIESLLKLFELWERRDDPVKQFSGGMKRRLEIARGLLHTPKILFLDEPTLGLDPQTRNQLWTHVKKLNEEERVTVFMTTHYMEEAERVAHRIAIIDHGKIVAQGTAQQLKQQTGGETLEQAFLALTGSMIRDEDASSVDQMRNMARMFRKGAIMSAIYILWLRQLKRYLRSKPRIIAALGQPLLFLVALGFGFGPIFQSAGQGNYIQFLAPGVIAMTILFTAVFSGIELIWDRQFGFLKETLVAPVPRILMMIGRTLGGATVAMLQGLIVIVICLIAGFRVTNFHALPEAILVMMLVSIMFTALGTAIASVLSDFQGFQLIMNFLVMPIFFLSGALFPLTNLPALLNVIATVDPLSYGVDGLRSALIGVAHFGLPLDLAVLSVIAALLLGTGSVLFSRIQL